MDETGAYNAIKPRLQGLGLDPQRIEDVTGRGTPDVNYNPGWIEMKYLAVWPVRPDTPVRIKTLVERPQQVAWLTRRWTSGGPAWLMVRVHHQYFLFAGPDSRAIRGGVPRREFEQISVWSTDQFGLGDWDALRGWLTWNLEGLGMIDRQRLEKARQPLITPGTITA